MAGTTAQRFGQLMVLAVATSCSRGVPPDVLLAKRELAAAYYEEERWNLARETIQWIIDHDAAEASDWINMACVEMETSTRLPEMRQYLDRAAKMDPSSPRVPFLLGYVDEMDMNPEASLADYQRAVELAPEDVPSRYKLATAFKKLGRTAEASRELEAILDRGVENTGSFHLSALYAYAGMLQLSQDPADRQRGEELKAQFKVLELELPVPNGRDQQRGYLGRVEAPARPAVAQSVGADPIVLRYEAVAQELAAEAGAIRELLPVDLDADGRLDLVLLGDDGAFIARQQEGATFTVERVASGRFDDVVAGDLANWGRSSLLLLGSGVPVLLAPDVDLDYRPADLPIAEARAAVFVDYDHEGDLDLVIAAADGVHLWRNDGLEGEPTDDLSERVRFADATAGSGVPTVACDWLTIEDFDNDRDIDLLAGAGDATVLISSLRAGKFEVLRSERTGITGGARPAVRDLDGDDRPDLVVAEGVLVNRGDNRFERAGPTLTAHPSVVLEDVDLDGRVDALWRRPEGGLALRRGSLLKEGVAVEALPDIAPGQGVFLVTDVDGDGDADVLAAGERGLGLWRSATSPAHRALRVRLEGKKDNRSAVGAIVELRDGSRYERQMCFGRQIAFGIGTLTTPEVVRVLWPNGVIQYAIHPQVGDVTQIEQKEGLVGSCPFLYTFDGEEYQFISDVLGITPLGLPMTEGQYVPPDHDELVRIEGSQLRPVDGEYRMQITEELREATYLDRAQLWVIDHDAGIEVHPEERFTFPPFPPLTIHTVREPLPLVAAVDGDGRDWTAQLRGIDGDHAAPFAPLPSQYLGLVTPHDLDLTLPEQVRDAARVRLLMTGWLYWTDASVNVAAGHHQSYAFVPPILSVPDANGVFRPTGPPVGFPAGKTKTMVLDVTELLNRDDLRLRIHASIRLYWDCIHVAVDAGDAPIEVTRLEPQSARLYHRGFSQPLPPKRDNQPERFVFGELREAPWNQHQGMLTRFGEVRELLLDIDDRFAIFGAGDAIDLRFDAAGFAQPAAGRARTFLLFVDGWAKDGDPNTAFAGQVEPLPFHGMSGYPYRADEHYPVDEVHDAYLREWNTRPGQRLIRSLVPDPSSNP